MHDTLVTLETAKLFHAINPDIAVFAYYANRIITLEDKEAGFNFRDNLPSYKLQYRQIGESDKYIAINDLYSTYRFDIPAPTQTAVQKYLLDIYDIMVTVDIDPDEYNGKLHYHANVVSADLDKPNLRLLGGMSTFEKYEHALEDGLLETCKYVIVNCSNMTKSKSKQF